MITMLAKYYLTAKFNWQLDLFISTRALPLGNPRYLLCPQSFYPFWCRTSLFVPSSIICSIPIFVRRPSTVVANMSCPIHTSYLISFFPYFHSSNLQTIIFIMFSCYFQTTLYKIVYLDLIFFLIPLPFILLVSEAYRMMSVLTFFSVTFTENRSNAFIIKYRSCIFHLHSHFY